jgi:Zn-dependent M16 (insulinase) family peptidase
MLRYLAGNTEEIRQRIRDEILAASASDFRAFADVLDSFNRKGIVKVLGSQKSIEEEANRKPGWLQLQKVL